MRTSAGLNVGAGGASAVSGSQTASDTAATTTRAKKPSKIRRSIVGPFVADPRASVTARPADGKRLICGRGAARRVQENLAQRRKGAKRKRHAKWHSHVRRGPPQCWKIKDLVARAIFFAPLRLCVFA